ARAAADADPAGRATARVRADRGGSRGGGSGCDHEVVAGPTGPAPPARRALAAQVHRGLPAVVAQADLQTVRTGCDLDGHGAQRLLEEVLQSQTEPMGARAHGCHPATSSSTS